MNSIVCGAGAVVVTIVVLSPFSGLGCSIRSVEGAKAGQSAPGP